MEYTKAEVKVGWPQWSYLPLTRTRRKPLTCITDLITAYREGATAASLAAAHGLSLTSVKRLLHIAGVRRTPPESPTR